jgi:hypothetical protein
MPIAVRLGVVDINIVDVNGIRVSKNNRSNGLWRGDDRDHIRVTLGAVGTLMDGDKHPFDGSATLISNDALEPLLGTDGKDQENFSDHG